MTTERESALERIVADEIAAHMATAKAPERQGNMVKALLGYTGGTFIFAGLGLLVSIIWPDISPLQRVIITLGPGMIAFVLGSSRTGIHNSPRRRPRSFWWPPSCSPRACSCSWTSSSPRPAIRNSPR